MLVLNGEWAAVSTLAGGVNGTATGVFINGIGTNAGFYYPFGLAVDASSNVFVADSFNHRIRKVTPVGSTRIGRINLRACCADIYIFCRALMHCC